MGAGIKNPAGGGVGGRVKMLQIAVRGWGLSKAEIFNLKVAE